MAFHSVTQLQGGGAHRNHITHPIN
uniref:Uncharacterized protein n=1 Tax=Anguilla anguilla TaxID=7936 RepID=A0A0E9VJ01_ANGAN